MTKQSLIYIAGHRGMVGSAIWRKLEAGGYTNLIGKTSAELDLRDQHAVNRFFDDNKPEIVIDAAARVGGILANNDFPYQFLMENLRIQNNLIDASHRSDVQKFIFLGSSCIYPKLAPQPLKEDYLLTASLEPTNEWEDKDKSDRYRFLEANGKEALFEKEDGSIRIIYEKRAADQLVIRRGEKKTGDWVFTDLFVFNRVR